MTVKLCRWGPNHWEILSILTLIIGESVGPTGEQSPVVTIFKNPLTFEVNIMQIMRERSDKSLLLILFLEDFFFRNIISKQSRLQLCLMTLLFPLNL